MCRLFIIPGCAGVTSLQRLPMRSIVVLSPSAVFALAAVHLVDQHELIEQANEKLRVVFNGFEARQTVDDHVVVLNVLNHFREQRVDIVIVGQLQQRQQIALGPIARPLNAIERQLLQQVALIKQRGL